ncbi:MAG: hypothetical protein AMJ78_09260 [Omnitrophica WOR_2 bacterium SM23_29]|nr:MAG: hypothetical protein AMJ78_09260 [Omnitrophica WOR_2 bacterium SM23_29]
MFWKKPREKEGQLKALSEKEIQKQLYGEYSGRGDRGFEVMDSSAIGEQEKGRPIEEKYDAKLKKELSKELENLKAEFKHLKEEVNRLKRQKETLERAGAGFKLPFLKTQHLVIIGSVVVSLAIIVAGLFVIKFMVTKVPTKKTKTVEIVGAPSKIYTIQAYTTLKRDDADKVFQLLLSKEFPATVKEVKSLSGRTQYVIFVGEYSSKKQASDTLQNLRREKEFRDSFVRKK